MGVINILDKQTANMIAAGEVVDRPSGALKELLENCIDAGATSVKVEIKGGGSSLMKVTDNGCGIERGDVPKALMRHATSKITCGADLDGIVTMGFRGEALAAISAVSRLEMVTRRAEDTEGTHMISDENGVIIDDIGCPVGTAITVRDLFYNTPARARFLKKDQTESASCSAVAEKIALANPGVAITFISEGDKKFATPGDGNIASTVYALFGSAVSKTLTECDYDYAEAGIKVKGFINRPESPRGSRNMQIFFVNNRFVRSKTVSAALEEAFRSYIPSNKYPAGILYITLDAHFTDVNVHPAKLEIRFADEKKIFEAVYYCVRNALENGKRRPEMPTYTQQPQQPRQNAQYTQHAQPFETQNRTAYTPHTQGNAYRSAGRDEYAIQGRKGSGIKSYALFDGNIAAEDATPDGNPDFIVRTPIPVEEPVDIEPEQTEMQSIDDVRIVGELYKTYVIAETSKSIFIFDKHAAHERILYEKLKNEKIISKQYLLTGVVVDLGRENAATINENAGYLSQFGFVSEPFGDSSVIIRAVPMSVSKTGDVREIVEAFADELSQGGAIPFAQKVDKALYTVACKAAVKAGRHTGEEQNLWLAQQLIADPSLRLCPHGRPFVREYPKNALDKLFDR